MNVAKKYNVKLIPLTDIYIGSGKDIEAYEYTVKDKYMYRICLLYTSPSPRDQA